jgi:hypothetical protein
VFLFWEVFWQQTRSLQSVEAARVERRRVWLDLDGPASTGSAGLACGGRLLHARNGAKQTNESCARDNAADTARYHQDAMVFI